ncbi:hypothetical protein GPECTOR_474g403 [Gonium pectorale]|uniref:Protein kinase domain-containing protein n=1 Tax=Gonium pectorale TaxID=33097 RepID=A0A150FW47_GONPE|nr:hypothetical protein GPECTOR_474g403 [Gonium pectorale]|eukprot:KXZ41425.1 hypothetical protein GPECTOR_474g403 [Gonium pectorale]
MSELQGGSTAVVYKALDLSTGSYVIHGQDRVPVKVVQREVAFSTSVTHDNLVRLLDVFAEGDQLVIVWELIEGCDLQVLLNERGGRMPEDEAAFYFTQALRGLVFMHANGFCHRDIKLENLMVQQSNYQLKLIDFGLSKHILSAKTLGIGTPELLRRYGYGTGLESEHPYDARKVDAWAMGVLMYLLVTGRYPFEDEHQPNNVTLTASNILAGRMHRLPPGVSAGCSALITGLLQPRAEARSTLEELVENQWLASAASQYARWLRATQLRDADPAAGPRPEQFVDLYSYKELAKQAAAVGCRRPSGRHGSSGSSSGGVPVLVPSPSAGRSTAAAPTPAGLAGPAAPDGGGGSHGNNGSSFSMGLLSTSSAALSDEMAAEAEALRHVAGVHVHRGHRAHLHHLHHHRPHGHSHRALEPNASSQARLDEQGAASETGSQQRARGPHHRHHHSHEEAAAAASAAAATPSAGRGMACVRREAPASEHEYPDEREEGRERHRPMGLLARLRAYVRRTLDCQS